MSMRRFEITRVPEPNRDNPSGQNPPEITPLVHIEHEIPSPPPLPTSILTSNPGNFKSKPFSSMLLRRSFGPRRRATMAAAKASAGNQLRKISSADIFCPPDPVVLLPNSVQEDESDVYSTTHSTNYDTNHSRTSNKFLQELRLKRRELFEKAKNISIDQRIAFYRRDNQRSIIRAEDIFAVHFEAIDEDGSTPPTDMDIFNEESQEKIRQNIFNELDRQRRKQYHRHHRHLLFGRSLLIFMTLLIALMSITLIGVMIDLYDRAKNLDAKLPENEFIPMIFDKTSNIH